MVPVKPMLDNHEGFVSDQKRKSKHSNSGLAIVRVAEEGLQDVCRGWVEASELQSNDPREMDSK